VRGRWKAATRKVRELAMVGARWLHTGHPVLAQIVPARFCNLSCGYCNEYDKVSSRCRWTRCTGASTTWDGWGRP
jgi:sulfatase maturation enzyme AslB (radical SAM superfamily)